MRHYSNPKKSLGQHFLYDQNIINKIIASANIQESDHILEVGAGKGHLTEALVNTGASVVSIEIDKELYENDLYRFQDKENVQILNMDIMDFEPEDFFKKPFKLVANLPYNIGSRVIRKLLFSYPNPILSVVMLQREVAMNIIAVPNKMNILSATFQAIAEIDLLFNVKPTSFIPSPKVTSSVLEFKFIDKSLISKDEFEKYFDFVVAAFSAPRKQIKNSLSLGLNISSESIANELGDIGIASTRRPQTLTIPEWKLLFNSFKSTLY